MAVGDALRLARADIAKQRLQVTKELGGVSDLLIQLGQQAGRRTAAEATALEREQFQTERGDIFQAIEAGTTTPEQRRRGFELGLLRPEVERPERPERELTSQQRLTQQVADLERKVLEGIATEADKASLERFRAARRVPVEERPSRIQQRLGRIRFEAFEASVLASPDIPAEEKQRFIFQVGSFIASMGFEDFDAGFNQLATALDQLIPEAEDDVERFDALITANNIVDNILRTTASPSAQRSALLIQERTLAEEIGAVPARNLIDFILKIKQQ